MFATAIGNYQTSPSVRPSPVFSGVHFVLLGFDPIKKSQVSQKLVNGGGVDAGQYGPSCTHVIVDKLVYDDPLCVAARKDGKILVSSLWVDHSFDVGAPVDTTSVMYIPVKDLNGIPGAKSLVICLTGYQREDREDIMTMVELIGAKVSKPLIGHKVTHLICYKFEGEKYVLARKMKRIKLINHRWLEDCLKAWKIVPEADYSKSGYELEMEAEAKDSEDEREGVNTRHNDVKIANLHHSLISKQEILKTLSNTSASELFSTAQETVSVTLKTTPDHFPNSHENKFKNQDTENLISVTSEPSTHYGKTASNPASTPTNRSPQIKAETVKSASYSMKDPIRTTPPEIERKSNTNSAKRQNNFNLSDAYDMPSSPVQKVTPYSSSAFCLEDEQIDALSNKRKDILKPQRTSPYKDAEIAYQGLKQDLQIGTSPAQNTPYNISGRKSFSSKGKNVTCDVTISKTFTSEIEDPSAVPRPQEEYKETGLSIKSNNRDLGMAESSMHSPSAVTSDLQKSNTSNSEINEQSAGSNPKPVRRKSISKKFSAPKLSKKNTLNQKGSIFLQNTEPEIDDENLFKYQQSEKVSSVAKSGTQIEIGVVSGMQIENTSENKSLCIDDETEPPDDDDQASKEKHEDGEQENAVDVLMEQRAERTADVVDPSSNKHNDENDLSSNKHKVSVHKSDEITEDLASEVPQTKKGKKNTAVSVAEVTHKKSVKNNELIIDNSYGKQEIREEATPNQAKKAWRNGQDLEKSTEVKRAGVCNDTGLNNDEKDDVVDANMDIESDVNKKETKRNTPSKTKKGVCKRNVTDLEKSLHVERSEHVYSDPEHQKERKDNDGADKGADVDTENVLNKKETKRNKRPLSGTKNDDAKAVNKKVKPSSNQAAKTCELEDAAEVNVQIYVDNGVDKDSEMDTGNFLNKKEIKRNKRPLSITKKDGAKAVNEKGNLTSNQADKTCDVEEKQNENVQIHVDDGADKDGDIDTENVLNKKETKKDDAKAVNKKRKPTSNQAVKMCDLDDAQKENVQIHVDDGADMDTENVLNKETKKHKRPLSRTKKDDAKAANKGNKTSNQAAKRRHLEEQKENIQINVDDQSASNKHIFKSAKEFPEKNVDKASSDVLKDEPRWFILTGHKLQRREFQQIIRRLKGRVCRVNHSWSYQATHFIVPDPIKRTEKFFAAAASGRWILKTDYLSASNQAGKFLAEETYEWHKNGLSEDGQVNLEAPRKWRLLKEKTGYGAFYGMKIVIYGECILPTLDTLKRAVKAGDGTILATSPPYTRFLNTGIDFAVVSPGMPHVDVWVQEFLKHEIPCVSADYLVEYVCKPGYPLEKHVLYGTNVWAERSLNSLKNRLEENISEPRTPNSNDVACEVCGSRDRGEEMLICGDESGVIGCGVGTHIDCCDPPLEGVPKEDWFCSKCSKKPKNSKSKKRSKRKGSASRGK